MSQRGEVLAFIQEALETIEAIHRREDSLHRYDQRTGGEAAKYYCDRITILQPVLTPVNFRDVLWTNGERSSKSSKG